MARANAHVRRHVTVRGLVQGVGYRPFVYRLAHELSLAGWVRNDGDGVEIEVQGAGDAIDALVARLACDAPPLAHVVSVAADETAVEPGAHGFAIVASRATPVRTEAGPDSAICADCLRELFDPANRRYRHPFISCTHCGPRYTIVERLPYDRSGTSMAAFALCPRCRQEYERPADRRFHAQPVACPDCGPRLSLLGEDGAPIACADVIARATARLLAGGIVAVKGPGGFHLCCDARNADAVARLRRRKAREEKPFAVMFPGVASLAGHADVTPGEARLLRARERPIVLVRKRADCDTTLAGVAPGLCWLGAMLPCTPLQHLLFHEAAGRPDGVAWLDSPQPLALVTTSANPCGEATIHANDDAVARLRGIADAILLHDCAIVNRCDDSVVRCGPEGTPRFLRRARSYTPRPIRLSGDGPAVLALGGDLKNTICLTRGAEAFVSQHVGDLDDACTRDALDEVVARLPALLRIAPQTIACDLHPDFHTTRLAERVAHERAVPLVRVQHHHAHVAAVVAEHARDEPVIGVALDGVGLGTDAGIWGGELLHVEGAAMTRLGHLLPLRLPGEDRAAREPWRMAAAALHLLGRPDEIARRYPGAGGIAVAQMLERGVRSPWTSSCGRWFDAAAGLLGVKSHSAFEGQAAMLLEGLAERHGPARPLPDGYAIDAHGRLDLRGVMAFIAGSHAPDHAAAVFHATLAAGLADWAAQAARCTGIRCVALAGGCFANLILATAVRAALAGRGLRTIEAAQVPPGDGGLSLGQAWVARCATRNR